MNLAPAARRDGARRPTLDGQLETITTEVDGTTSSLLRAEDELAVKKAVLQRRLVDIYKRGPMYSTEALLAARTFGELLGRYKYLHELAVRDRALVARVRGPARSGREAAPAARSPAR